ncbi:hypothetical protein LCGC14_3076990, partial [marine sediment metagenome]
EYGPERMGAPTRSFTRISESPITLHSNVRNPDAVVVLDSSLLDTIDVVDGLSEEGVLLINTSQPPQEIRQKLNLKKRKVFTVDASSISLDILGRNLPNTPMLGALIKATDLLSIDTIISAIKHKFEKKFSSRILEGNIQAIRKAYEEVKNKLNLGYEFLGEHTAKNIIEPVRVYRVLMEPEDAGKLIGEEKTKTKRWGWALAAAAVVVLIAGGLSIWQFYFRPPPIEPASVEEMALPLPEKPSIAVLPFDNLSDDPKQEYFADGMTDDLITDLSKISGLFVIARNSTFQYKGKAADFKKISRELGIRYVLEGSVRRVQNKVRINAQLIDATTGGHLWAERYDRHYTDIF